LARTVRTGPVALKMAMGRSGGESPGLERGSMELLRTHHGRDKCRAVLVANKVITVPLRLGADNNELYELGLHLHAGAWEGGFKAPERVEPVNQ
jgi:hypothetical protein